MSQQPISLSRDLRQLRDDGYDVEIRAGYLLVKDVPYVTVDRVVKIGILVSELNLGGNITSAPGTHVVHFIGEYPCNELGAALEAIRNESRRQQFGENLTIDHSFSSKPIDGGYRDYYHKMTTYVAILSNPARSIDQDATARRYNVVPPYEDDDSVFCYIDTASSRARIGAATAKLTLRRIAIIGVGGT